MNFETLLCHALYTFASIQIHVGSINAWFSRFRMTPLVIC